MRSEGLLLRRAGYVATGVRDWDHRALCSAEVSVTQVRCAGQALDEERTA